MTTVVSAERKSAVLAPSALPCLAAMPTINFTAGCAHGCVYCYTRGYSTYPGAGRVVVYANTLAKLKGELARKRTLPKAVYFSPSSDPFQPVKEVYDLAFETMKLLLEWGVGVAFLTKGLIPQRHLDLFANHAPLVQGQVGVTTLDENIALELEPNAPTPYARLNQAAKLVEAGIATQLRLDPIVPGMTDNPDSLQALMKAIKATGAKRVVASTLFMRPSLLKTMADNSTLRELYKRFYQQGQRLRINAEHSEVIAMPKTDREELYANLRRLAEKTGLIVRICGCKNPDIGSGTCNIAGDWSAGLLPGIMALWSADQTKETW